MTKVVLQPCGNGLPAKHYTDTVENAVPLSHIASFLLPDDLDDLKRKFPEGNAAAWGVTPGEESSNRKKWNRMTLGDVALFSREGRIFSSGTVAKKMHNAILSRHLWGEDEAGETWEYMYFLSDIRHVDSRTASETLTTRAFEGSLAVMSVAPTNFPSIEGLFEYCLWFWHIFFLLINTVKPDMPSTVFKAYEVFQTPML